MNSTLHPTRLFAIAVVTAALVTACGGTAARTSTNAPATATPIPISLAAVQVLLDEWAEQSRGGVAVAMAGTDDELTVAAAGTDGPDGGNLATDAAFRVGSLSKTFVAVMLLQLVDDGTVGLDDLVDEHAPELTIAAGITIRQLLAHRSGIPEPTYGELVPKVLADPTQTWTPADVLDLVDDQPRDFQPGAQFAYSNTNYIVAGLLLEAVTGLSLSDNLQTRITDPLGLMSTYFTPDQTRVPIGGFSMSLTGGDTNGASYHALETAAGAAGALVSTVGDLAVFIRALAHGELLDQATYAEMTRGLPDNGETLGVFRADPATATGISHDGAIFGFTAYMQYDPATQDLFVFLLNDDTRSPQQLRSDLLDIVHNALGP